MALVDGTPGVDIYPELALASGEHIIKKHRYSGFFGTDLDIILREWSVDTVIISGTTTENGCHATARDAMFSNYKVIFLSDATATYDYPDRGFGAMPNAEVHHATLAIEFYDGGIQWFVHQLPDGQYTLAITLGNVVLGQTDASLEFSRKHEAVHIAQYEQWGPLMIPVYYLTSVWVWLFGKRFYRDNPFEREANDAGRDEHDR